MYFDFVNKSEFFGNLQDMVKVYQQADEGRLEYDYDAGGNRTAKRKVVGNVEEITYEYYPQSNRLKKTVNNLTGECWCYVYDANGNLVEKGNKFTENFDGSIDFVKDGSGDIGGMNIMSGID